jgi:hypothetical protein
MIRYVYVHVPPQVMTKCKAAAKGEDEAYQSCIPFLGGASEKLAPLTFPFNVSYLANSNDSVGSS